MISPPRDIFSDALCVPAPKPPRAPVVDAMASMAEEDLAKAMAAAKKLDAVTIPAGQHPSLFLKYLAKRNGPVLLSELADEFKMGARSASNFMRQPVNCGLAVVSGRNIRTYRITRAGRRSVEEGKLTVERKPYKDTDLQRAGCQPQREVGVSQGDGAGKQVGPLAGKFKGVK